MGIKHSFTSPKAETSDPSLVGANEWNDNHVIDPGTITATMLASTSVTPGTYTNVTLTVNAKGQITAASNGSTTGSSKYLGLSRQSSDPAPPGVPDYLWMSTNGTLSLVRNGISTTIAAGGFGGFNIALHGDSNIYGYSDTDKADPSFSVTTAYTQATLETNNNIGDPTTQITQVRGDVKPYAAGGGASMGMEISLARYLNNHGASGGLTPHLIKFAWYGRALNDWQSSSTFPTVGGNPNIITQAYAQLDAALLASGNPLSAVVYGSGANDATTSPLTTNYTANLTSYISGMRTRYGSNLLLVLIKLHANTTTTYSVNRDTIRAAQVAYAATDAHCVLIDIDDLTLNSDLIHWSANAQIAIGNRVGEAIGNALVSGYTGNRAATAAPYVQGWNPAGAGASSITVPLYPHKAGDWMYLHATAANGTSSGTIATPSGWTLVGSQRVGTFAGAYAISAVFKLKATTSGTTPPVVAMPAGYSDIAARAVSVRNANATTPEDGTPTGAAATVYDGTAVSVPGNSTSGANRLLLEFFGAFLGGGGAHSITGYSASNVTLTEAYDDDLLAASNHVGLAMATGTIPSAVTYGTTTATYTATYSVWGAHTIAVQP